jgi:hypothetical protein
MIINRAAVALAVLFAFSGTYTAFSQASKKLEEKAKGMDQGQQNSWQQVDQINKETDKTKGRYQQAQQAGAQRSPKASVTVKKTRVGTGSAYKKATPKKKTLPPKK